MSEKLLVPDIGDFEEVEVIEVLAKQGDQLNINDPVITIESDKSSVEIPSTVTGKIETVQVKVGDKVSKGDIILSVISSGENKKDTPIPKDTESIIKQAEAAMVEKKRRDSSFSTNSKERTNNYSSN
jgi:pyruvate dehydrogenase E1 component